MSDTPNKDIMYTELQVREAVELAREFNSQDGIVDINIVVAFHKETKDLREAHSSDDIINILKTETPNNDNVRHSSVMCLTKREHFASLTLQGLLANSNHDLTVRDYVSNSLKLADQLIKQLNN